MAFTVLLTDDAAHDLDELYAHIARHDAPEKADYVLEKIENAFSNLSESPERSAYPKELLVLGIREYREIFFKQLPHTTKPSSQHRRLFIPSQRCR